MCKLKIPSVIAFTVSHSIALLFNAGSIKYTIRVSMHLYRKTLRKFDQVTMVTVMQGIGLQAIVHYIVCLLMLYSIVSGKGRSKQ